MSTETETTETKGTATYSPDDNKLRFYPDARLSAEDYKRVTDHGFRWAPKQELFVAPMWSPDREDLMLSWCGEIGDEDKSLVERAEDRAERFEDYSDKRSEDAARAHKAVESICEHIPLGQPILIGHHSERRARKDAERIRSGMRKALAMWDTSKYWSDRAKSAISHAKYKEQPDVRARRIKTLEADKRRQERAKAEAENCFKFWRGECVMVKPATGEKSVLAMTEENKQRILNFIGHSGQDYSRLSVIIARYQRWITHYENRLAYERAMLEADGGTATDRKAPEVGGGVKCWASVSGCWSYVQKVNRVSVTVLDNWGNGGRNFTRTIPFDKCFAILTAAEVRAAREAGRLIETSCKTGFGLCDDGTAKTATETPEQRAQRQHAEHMAKQAKVEEAKPFEAMRQTLKSGVQVVSAPDLFPTPPHIAARMAEIAFEQGWSVQVAAGMNSECRILEPSAGTGNLLRAIADACDFESNMANVTAVEINLNLAAALASGFPKSDIRRGDFLSFNGELGKFDRVLMNPPFSDGQDIKHIQHAVGLLSEGGRLVALCADGPRQRAALEPLAKSWETLPAGSFKESGTGVSVALLVIDR